MKTQGKDKLKALIAVKEMNRAINEVEDVEVRNRLRILIGIILENI